MSSREWDFGNVLRRRFTASCLGAASLIGNFRDRFLKGEPVVWWGLQHRIVHLGVSAFRCRLSKEMLFIK